jgi:hypothetical protein
MTSSFHLATYSICYDDITEYRKLQIMNIEQWPNVYRPSSHSLVIKYVHKGITSKEVVLGLVWLD